jgi:hypothetical protein
LFSLSRVVAAVGAALLAVGGEEVEALPPVRPLDGIVLTNAASYARPASSSSTK